MISFSFDAQAPSFDARTGLTDAVASEIARAILAVSGVAVGTNIVEVGAGNREKPARPADSVRSWMSKESMGGIVPLASIKAAILDELMAWAAERFGSPEKEIVSTERYVLEGVRLSKTENT